MTIRRARHDSIHELRLDRPPANALDADLLDELVTAVREAPSEGAEALVLSGAPGMFSAGLDIPALLALDADGLERLWRSLTGAMRALGGSPLPVAAALTGHAPAGGTVLALCCDHRVMARGELVVGLNEVALGITMPEMVLLLMTRAVGARAAERLAVGGRLLRPEEALAVGLVDELAPPDEVVARAIDWCRELLRLPRQAMLETRRLARGDLAHLQPEDHETLIARLVEEVQSPEARDALSAVAARLAAR